MSALSDPARGLYETVLILDGRPVGLARHLARLATSARERFGAPLPDDLEAGATEACAGIALGRLRIDVVFAPGRPTWSVRATPVEPDEFFPDPSQGVELRGVAAPEWSGAHKWADREWLEGLERDLDPALPLLLGADGQVLEAARANVFAVSGGALRTPPLDGRILPGTARAQVLELADELGIEALAAPLTPADLKGAEEVFLTSSVRGIRPVASLDGVPLPRHELTGYLAAALRRRWLERAA